MRTALSRTLPAAITACALLLVFAAESYPSYDTEAGRKYAVARQRLDDLKKSKKRQRYRSSWMDCVRTFELVEKKYPKSASAGDACVDRAGLYLDLYGISKISRDKNQALKAYAACQTSYPRHARAAEALFHSIEIYLDYNKDAVSANRVFAALAKDYPDSDWTGRAKTRLGLTEKAQKKPAEFRKPPKTQERSAAGNAPKSSDQQPVDPSLLGTVTGIRQWSSENYTRIVIELDKPLNKFPDTNELKNPDRLVFDLSGMRMADSLSRAPLVLNNGILRQVRSSQFDPSTVRVVLDLASIKSYAAFPLREPNRLVIDVTGDDAIHAAANAPARIEADTKTQSALEVPAIAPDKPKPAQSRPAPPVPQAKPGNDGDRLTLSRQLGLKVKTIAIDAGHGGKDPGAIGKSGLKEKTITLDVAKRLAKLVKEQLGCNIVMTRDKDVFIPLDKRPFIAKSHNADLFVSIHVNANRKRMTRGIETYVQGLKATDREAMATAARENAMSERSIGELDSEVDKMLKDLRIDNKIEESIQLAGTIQTSLINTVKPVQKTVINHGVKSAFFYVLMNTNIPSILAEVGFISNPEEEKLLNKESYRQKIAEAIFQGIKQYVDAFNPQVLGI